MLYVRIVGGQERYTFSKWTLHEVHGQPNERYRVRRLLPLRPGGRVKVRV